MVASSGRVSARFGPILLGLLLISAALTGCAASVAATGGESTRDAGQEAPASGETTSTTVFVMPLLDDACLSCHEDTLDELATTEDPKVFAHRPHVSQRIMCSSCHEAYGHSGDPRPVSETCDECHGLKMPHHADYGVAHGREVLALDSSKVCENCHNIYLHCQTCHGVQMPHPDQWEAKHGEIAYPRLEMCSTCHPDEDCLACHPVAMPHPREWTKTHGLPVIDSGSKMCTSCHEPQQCVACHGMPMPHPSDWGAAHSEMAATKRGECSICHVDEDCIDCHQIHDTHGKGGAG
ncbi:MAG: cytochrome c3 family protein [Actinobacteria bacterium]|nr:cytochrome c3 family protein [Actinomycetota bacterium]